MKTLLIALSSLGLAASVHAEPQTSPAMHLQDMPLHDPFIVADKASHTYYLYTSNVPGMTGVCAIGTMVYESKDLRDWAAPKVVFTLPKDSWADGGGWAPEVHLWQGHYYLFTTVHNEAAPIPGEAKPNRHPYRRGTVLARADRPEGPFTLVHDGEPVAGAARMTLDGTLYVDPQGKPWEVYAHEWLQQTDGTMEAVPLDKDLKAAGAPVVLFQASDATWVKGSNKGPDDTVYVTDGPELYRTKDGHLLMLWSSYDAKGYVESEARSDSGDIRGPWTQLEPLVRQDSGHGMLFHGFDGKLMLVMHRPFKNARGKIYEVADAGDHLEIVRERTDLDFDGTPSAPLPRANCKAGG